MPAKKPTKILQLNGAYKKDPQRKREPEPEPSEPVGECPSHLSETHKIIWDEIVNNCVDGVLTIQDRHNLEIIVTGFHDIRHGVETDEGIKQVGGAERDRVFKQLGKFGMTPVDRTNVQVAKAKEKPSGFTTGL